MTARQMAVIKTIKMLSISFGAALLTGLTIHFIPLNYIFMTGLAALVAFAIKIIYDVNLVEARRELKENQTE